MYTRGLDHDAEQLGRNCSATRGAGPSTGLERGAANDDEDPLLFATFGAPSALSYATNRIVLQIARTLFAQPSLIQATGVADLKHAWENLDAAQRKSVVLFSDCPQGELLQLIIATRAPIVVVVEDISSILFYVMRSRGMDFPQTTRFVTQVLCALERAGKSPNVLRISSLDLGRSLRNLIAGLVQFYGAQCDVAQFDEMVASVSVGMAGGTDTVYDFVEAHFPHARTDQLQKIDLTDAQRRQLAVLERGYGELVAGRPLTAVNWPTELFLKWDVQGAFLDGAIELTGPARFIICGPYLHLPEGHWRMTVEIGVEECFSDNRLGADIFSQDILTAVEFRLPANGDFAFDLDFQIVNTLAPIELRVQLLTGAIEGRLTLRSVELRFLDADGAPAPDFLHERDAH